MPPTRPPLLPPSLQPRAPPARPAPRAPAAAPSDGGGNPLADNPLFAANPAFAAALRGALEREGEDALSSGQSVDEDE